jgi:hypothetical protein
LGSRTRPTEIIKEARREIQSHLQEKNASWGYKIWRLFNSVNTAELRHVFPLPLAKDSALSSVLAATVEHVRPVLEDLLSEDAALVEFSGMSSLPGSEEQQMHSDIPFQDSEWRTNPLILSVFVAMEDITVDKGPTCLYAGTHDKWFHELIRADATKPKVYNPDGSTDEPETAPSTIVSEAKAWLGTQTPQHALLNAGDVLIFNTKVFHFGTSNISSTSRDLLSFSFQQKGSCGGSPPIEGFTYHIQPDLRGKYELRDFRRPHESPLIT